MVALSREHGLAALLARMECCLGLGAREARRSGRRPRPSFEQALRNSQSRQQVLSSTVYRRAARRNRSRAGEARSRPGRDRRSAGAGGRDRSALVRRRHCIAFAAKSSLKHNPADPAPAEAAFLAAIAVAQQQKARSFELRAALSLAKLYQSTGRPTDAHDVLGPALEGFSPTPEFPQIAEAQTLFEALAADERG